MQQGVNNCG
jgi:hypothetical protein